jgi:hypothetical protein
MLRRQRFFWAPTWKSAVFCGATTLKMRKSAQQVRARHALPMISEQ